MTIKITNVSDVANLKWLQLVAESAIKRGEPREFTHYLHHDGEGSWVSSDGKRAHLARACAKALPKGAYKVTSNRKTFLIMEEAKAEVPSTVWAFFEAGKGYVQIDVPQLPMPATDSSLEFSEVYTYELAALIGMIQGGNGNKAGINIKYLHQAVLGGVLKVYKPVEIYQPLILTCSIARSAVVMPAKV